MSSLNSNTNHIVDRISNKVLVITRPPLRARALLLKKTFAAFTDRNYVETCILRGVSQLKDAFNPGKPVGAAPAQIKIARAENRTTIDRAFTTLVDTYVVQEATPVTVAAGGYLKFRREQDENDRIKKIKDLIKTTSQTIESQQTIEKIKRMLNLKSPIFTITRGSELDERENVVYRYAVISRYFTGNQREEEHMLADEKAIIAEFKKKPEKEQQRIYEDLKSSYFSLD